MSVQRSTELTAGAVVVFHAETWRVAGLDALRVHLTPLTPGRVPAVWLVSELVAADDFKVLADADGVAVLDTDPGEYADLFTLDALEEAERLEVERRAEAALLVRDGRLPGTLPDPQLDGLTQTARLAILAERYEVSTRTLKGWLHRLREGGVAALVDRRRQGATGTPLTKIDARWREAIRIVFSDYYDQTNLTDGYLVEKVRQEAAARFGDDVPQASDRTLRRYLEQVAPQRRQSTKTQRSRANAPAPDRWWKPMCPGRPGQVIAIDTQYLDAFALEPVSGKWQRVQLLMAVDVYSRSIVGWRFTAWHPTSQDVALLLRHVVTPKKADPSWPAEGLWRYTGVPEHVVAGLLHSDPLYATDEAAASEANPSGFRVAGIPVLIPDEVALDHGRDYLGKHTQAACALLGSTMGLARPYTPTDKAHIERAFATVNTSFVQRLPGYKGPDIASRGAQKYVEDAAFHTLDEIEARFAAWVAIEYQNTPHAGLRHPNLPKVVLNPNQMVDMAMATSGFIPVPIDTNLQVELLPTEWRRVTNEGIRVGNLSYDFPGASVLDDYRNRPAVYGSQQAPDGERRWRVKVDGRDLSGVWFYAYTTPENPVPGEGQWVRVPLRNLPDAVPFQDRHLAYAKRLAIQAQEDPTDRDTVVRRLRQVLNTISNPTDAMTTAEKRLAAHAHAHRLASRAAEKSGLLDAVPEDPDEYYYAGPDSDDDAELTRRDATSTKLPQPEPPGTVPVSAPTPFPTDVVEEWDPFDDIPDIA